MITGWGISCMLAIWPSKAARCPNLSRISSPLKMHWRSTPRDSYVCYSCSISGRIRWIMVKTAWRLPSDTKRWSTWVGLFIQSVGIMLVEYNPQESSFFSWKIHWLKYRYKRWIFIDNYKEKCIILNSIALFT